MIEHEFKELCNWVVDNANRQLTKEEKEAAKIAIEESNSVEELFLTAITIAGIK